MISILGSPAFNESCVQDPVSDFRTIKAPIGESPRLREKSIRVLA